MILFKLIVLTVICVMALKIIMSEGMLLEKLGKWLEYKVNDVYQDGMLVKNGNKFYDLFICPWCMNTLQSITAHALAFGLGIIALDFNLHFFIRWILVIMASSFVSGNIWNLYETINKIKDRNEAQTDFYRSAADTAETITESFYTELEEQEEYFEPQHN